MRKRAFLVAALGLAAVLVAGGLVASNMGFKANYPLDGPGINGSATGQNTIGLPYNQQTNLLVAGDLIADINADAGSAVVASVARFVRTSDAFESYTGFAGVDFALVPGDGYFVAMSSVAPVNYIIVGSHNPSLAYVLDGPGANGSATGQQLYSPPYHGLVTNAGDLINEINAAGGGSVVASVARFVRISDAFESYTGFAGVDFAVVPGDSYFVAMSASVPAYIPAHY